MNFKQLVSQDREELDEYGQFDDRSSDHRRSGRTKSNRRSNSRQRTLLDDGSLSRIEQADAQPQDRKRSKKPPLAGQGRKSGSRQRKKQSAERKNRPAPDDSMQEHSLGMMQIVSQLKEEEEQKAIEQQIDAENKAKQKQRIEAKKKKSVMIIEDAAKDDNRNEQTGDGDHQGGHQQYQAYVRQTWDISRFINPDGSPQFDSMMKAPTQKTRGAAQGPKNPTICKCWEQFNDFYITFIQDIDHFYQIQDANSSKAKPISPAKSQSMFGTTADGPDNEDEAEDEEDLTPEVKHLRSQLAKYKYQFTNIPEISQNILGIIRALKEEDKQEMIRLRNQQQSGYISINAHPGAMGENLEYFLENKVIETLAAYAMTDQPQGFFKFLLGVIKDLISSVSKQNNILSHISVNQSIRQILRTIYEKLLEIPFTESNTKKSRRPDDEFVLKQRPRVVFYTIDILQFINTITFKVQNEPHLIRLLFCKRDGLLNKYGHGDDSFQELTTHELRLLELRQYQQGADPATGTGVLFGASGASPVRNQNFMEDIVSYDICLPFHILVYYLKNAKCMLSECEKNFLDDVIVMSFNSLCIDAKFVCYLINESDFIEILMSEIATCVTSLPLILQPLDEMGHYNTFKQLENMNPRLINEQLQDLVTNCKLLHFIFEKLNLQAKSIHDMRVKKEDGFNKLMCIAEIQKALLREYIQIVLINTIQEKLLVGSPLANGAADTTTFSQMNDLATLSNYESEMIRTTIQYLIEILDSLQAKPFSLVTFAFLNSTLSNNLDRYLSDILQESIRATQAATPSQSVGHQVLEKYDYQKRNKQNIQILDELKINVQSGDPMAQGGSNVHKMESSTILDQLHNEDNVRNMVERLYPERQTVSRFSLKNPNARFTQTHDMLRKTIKEYKELGKLPNIPLEDMDDQDVIAGGGINSSNFASSRGLVNTLLFQKQGVNTGTGAPSTNLFACETLVNQTLQEQLFTHKNIDQLFTQAQNLEAQEKFEDEYMDKLQLQQFKNYTFSGMMHREVRLQYQHLVFRSQSDVSMISLKLLSTLIKSGGVANFIKENFKIDQTIYRTTDDISHLNIKYRLMLPISSQPRQLCLADYPEVVFRSIDRQGSSPLDVTTKMNVLDHCMTLLGHQLIHRQLIQLYFSDEYAIHFRLKTQIKEPKEKTTVKQSATPSSNEKLQDRSRLLAAAGVGGTDSRVMEQRFKDIQAQLASPSTNVTSKIRSGTAGSTGDTGGISDFEHGLQGNSPLRKSKKSVNFVAESFEESQINLKQQSQTASRPNSVVGLFSSGIQAAGAKAQIAENIRSYSHVWEMLLQKLLQFMDNTPNENAVLCQCILQLYEIPGQDKLTAKPKARVARKKQADTKPPFELIPLELLQWWLYSIEFVEKAPQKLSKRQQKQINDFKQNFDKLRRKYKQNTSKQNKNKKRSTPLSTNHSSQKKGKGHIEDIDHFCDPKFNILSTIAKVKAHLDLFEEDSKVQLFKQVLLEDHTQRSTKKKGARTSATSRTSTHSARAVDGQPGGPADPAKTAYDQKVEEMKEKQRQKLQEELNQPFIFRDRNLIAAENCLIFTEFYERLWEQLSIISVAIYQIRACGPSQQESLYEKEFCQEGSIVCMSEEQRETLVCRKETRLDIWNGKIDNINESVDQDGDSNSESFTQSFISCTK